MNDGEQVHKDDPRFTTGLMFDVFAVLGQHGYQIGNDDRCFARAMTALLGLTRAYEGTEVSR